MNLMRTYICFLITASIALYASAFVAMAAPVTTCCADASPVRTEGSREQDLTLSFVAPKGSGHSVYVEMYDAKHNLVMQAKTDDARVVMHLPSGTYYGTATHGTDRENFNSTLNVGHDTLTVVTFDA